MEPTRDEEERAAEARQAPAGALAAAKVEAAGKVRELGGGAGGDGEEEDPVEVRGVAVGPAEQDRLRQRVVDDLVRGQDLDRTWQAAIDGCGSAGNVSASWGVSGSGAIGPSFSSPASPEDTIVDTAMLQRVLVGLDDHVLLQELERRRDVGSARCLQPGTTGDVNGCVWGTEMGGGSVDAAVTRPLAKSQQQRRLLVWEAPLAGSWLILKGGFFFDEIISRSTVQATTRFVAFPDAAMIHQISTLAGIDVAKFSPPLAAGLTPSPVSPEDHFETFVHVFVTMLKLGMADALPVSVRRVAQLCRDLGLIAKELSQYMRFHRLELQPHLVEARAMLIAAANVDLNHWLADVADLGISEQRRSREQPPVGNATPGLPDLLFSRLRMLLGDSKGLTVVERIEKRGTKKPSTISRVGAAVAVGDGGTKETKKRTVAGAGDGDGKSRMTGRGVALVRGPAGGGCSTFPSFKAERNFWKTPAGVCHDRWRGLECRKLGCESQHSFTHLRVDAMWERLLGGRRMLMGSAATASLGGDNTVSGDGNAVGGGGEGGFGSGEGFAQSQGGGGVMRGGGRTGIGPFGEGWGRC